MNEKEIETYAQRRAKEHAEREGDNGNAEISFREGFSAGRELGRLEGQIEALEIMLSVNPDSPPLQIAVREAREILAALLGSEKVE